MENLIELKNRQNNLFFTPDLIYKRLLQTYRVKMQEYNIVNVIDWCAELEQEIIVDVEALIRFKGVQVGFPQEDGTLIISNDMVPVPRFVHRIDRIYDEDNNLILGAGYNGSYIVLPSTFEGDEVYIDGYSLPFDPETMRPLLLKGHEQAAYHFCVLKMFEEDIALQRVAFVIGQQLKANFEQAVSEAGGTLMRLLSSEDYIRYANIMMDLYPDITNVFKQG